MSTGAQRPPDPRLHRLHRLPGRRPVAQALGREANHLRPGIGLVGGSADAAQGLELVQDLHHGLFGDRGPVGQLGEAGTRPVDQQEGGGLAGAQVGDTAILEAPPDLGVQGPEGREQQVGEIRLRHRDWMVNDAVAFVKQPDQPAFG